MANIRYHQELVRRREIVKHPCYKCDQKGYVSGGSKDCPDCDNGVASGFFGDKICSRCDGDGRIYFSKECSSCDGKGYKKRVEWVEYCQICKSESEYCSCPTDREDYGGEYY